MPRQKCDSMGHNKNHQEYKNNKTNKQTKRRGSVTHMVYTSDCDDKIVLLSLRLRGRISVDKAEDSCHKFVI